MFVSPFGKQGNSSSSHPNAGASQKNEGAMLGMAPVQGDSV
jgi:hypothetical protein